MTAESEHLAKIEDRARRFREAEARVTAARVALGDERRALVAELRAAAEAGVMRKDMAAASGFHRNTIGQYIERGRAYPPTARS